MVNLASSNDENVIYECTSGAPHRDLKEILYSKEVKQIKINIQKKHLRFNVGCEPTIRKDISSHSFPKNLKSIWSFIIFCHVTLTLE